MNVIGKLAILFIVVGAVLLAGPVFGFSSLAADRGVFVDVASEQENALLGIQDQTTNNNVQIRPNTGDEPIHLLDNGVGITSVDDIDVSVTEFDGQADDGFDVTVTEEAGEYPITVECAGSDGGDGLMTLEITVAGDATVTTTYTTEASVDVNCGGGDGPSGVPNLTINSVEPADGGFVEFELNNTGEDFTIREISVDHGGSQEITNESRLTTETETETVSENPTWPTDGSRVGVGGGGFTLVSGSTTTVEIDEFDVDMEGESFDVTFVDDRGPSDTIETITVEVPCDPDLSDCS